MWRDRKWNAREIEERERIEQMGGVQVRQPGVSSLPGK